MIREDGLGETLNSIRDREAENKDKDKIKVTSLQGRQRPSLRAGGVSQVTVGGGSRTGGKRRKNIS